MTTSSTNTSSCPVHPKEPAENRPPELHVQRFLREGGTPEQLLTRYGIKAKPHPTWPITLFIYDQLASKPAEPIVRECRGLILENGTWNIVCRTMSRFANLGESWCDEIDWETACVQEKVDGSLAQLSFYDGFWFVATKGTPDAGGDVNGYGITFRQYFWDTFWQYGDLLPPDEGRCYWFELSGPMNRIVVRHPKPHLTLLGARDLRTDKEIRLEDITAFPSIPRVKQYPLKNVDEIMATFPASSALDLEGYVVCDAQFRRVKIKSPQYLVMHRLAGNGRMSPKRALELVRTGETSEVLAAFPEYSEIVRKVQDAYTSLVSEAESTYEKHKNITVQKDFAIAIKDSRCKHAMFAVRNKKADSFADYFGNARLDMLLDLLGYEDEPEAEAAQ